MCGLLHFLLRNLSSRFTVMIFILSALCFVVEVYIIKELGGTEREMVFTTLSTVLSLSIFI